MVSKAKICLLHSSELEDSMTFTFVGYYRSMELVRVAMCGALDSVLPRVFGLLVLATLLLFALAALVYDSLHSFIGRVFIWFMFVLQVKQEGFVKSTSRFASSCG